MDFQDPDLLPKLIRQWKEGATVVMCRKTSSDELLSYKLLRRLYYRILAFSHPMYKDIKGCTGFGIYDRKVIDRLSNIRDNYPFFRGLVAEVCSDIHYLDYRRPARVAGKSSMNFFKLWDEGIVGLINNSKVAIRLVTLIGTACAVVSVLAGITAIGLKIYFWDHFPMGVIPIILLQLFSVGCIMLSLGILGEYIGGIYTQSIGRSRVYEKKRINC